MRKQGYYWTKLNGKWGVTYYSGSNWLAPGFMYPLGDEDFEDIAEAALFRSMGEIIELPKNKPDGL